MTSYAIFMQERRKEEEDRKAQEILQRRRREIDEAERLEREQASADEK